MKKPQFSLLMAIYYREKPEYLESCLESILNQTLAPTEIILVEDGPLIPSLYSILDKYSNLLPINRIALSKNYGLAYALNYGLDVCKFNLVARMDTDDISVPNRFEIQVSFMLENPNVSASSGLVEEFDDYLNTVSLRYLPLDHSDLANFARIRSPLSHPACIFRKSSILAVGGYPDIYPEDYILWVKLVQSNYLIANVPNLLLKMRTNADFLKRRGFKFFVGELKIHNYMLKTRFISLPVYLYLVFFKFIVRISPLFLRSFFYRVIR